MSGAESGEEFDVLGEVPVAEEVVLDAGARSAPQSFGEPMVLEQAGRRGGAGVEVVRLDQQAVVFVDDLVLYPTDPTGDDRTRSSTDTMAC